MTETHPNTSLILLCTTAYNNVTCLMTRLLEGFSHPKANVHHVALERSDETYAKILVPYQNQRNVVLMFFGNGEDNALLVATQQDCDALEEYPDEAIFYDSDSFDLGPQTLVAFCSNAGLQLGPDFTRANGGTFFGFSDQLCLIDSVNDECERWWRKALHALAQTVIEDEAINEQTVDLVRSHFLEAYDFFCSEEGGLIEEALGMRMCLRRNLAALCSY